ncbi:TolC family protein [Oceanicaulis sp. MMSF_3324]|uniref:TolC family protein n=1 Tax=Oceanicaulis sp. MMSF_3324 TaxID=3046702 RepID=UPI00273F5ECD|nr:TolC family protein [Oceanicaulis sp. MMSF_3324]
MLILAALAATLSATPAPALADLSARLDEHPALAALAVEAEARRLEGRSRLGLPNPSIALGVNNVPVNDPFQFDEYLPSSKSVTVTQALPSRGLRQARTAADEARAYIALTMMGMRRDQLEAALHVSLREIDAADTIEQLVARQLAVYDDLAEVLESAAATGESRFAALADIDAERAAADTTAADAARMAAQARSRLESLVGAVDTAPRLETIEPPMSDEPLRFHAVALAEAQARAAEAGVEIRERDFDLGYEVSVSYFQRESGAMFEGDDWVSARVGVSIPLWSRWNQQPALEAARRDADAAALRTADARRNALDEYRAATAAFASALRSRTALEDRIAALEALSDAAQREYEAGSGDLRPVLEARANALEVRVRVLQLQLQADRAAARMHALTLD